MGRAYVTACAPPNLNCIFVFCILGIGFLILNVLVVGAAHGRPLRAMKALRQVSCPTKRAMNGNQGCAHEWSNENEPCSVNRVSETAVGKLVPSNQI